MTTRSYFYQCFRKVTINTLWVCLSVGVVACTGSAIVVINRTPITQADLAAAVAITNQQFDPVVQRQPEHLQQLATSTLEELIDGVLIEQELRATNTLPSDADIQEHIDAEKGSYTEETFRAELADRHIDYDTWTQQRRRQILADAFRDQLRATLPAPNSSDIKSYYAAHRDEFVAPAAVRVRHLITDSAAKATDLLNQLKAGGNFAHLASEHSIAPEAAQGGDLGWITKGQLPAAFDACFTLPLGELSAVIPSEYGFHIFKVLERRAAEPTTLADATADITERLQSQQLVTTYANAVAALRAKATIDRKPVPIMAAGTTSGVAP